MKKKMIALFMVAGIICTIIPISIWAIHQASLTNMNNQIGGIIINHNTAHKDDLESIPEEWIIQAKSTLHVVYWHTSHGGQLTEGMSNLDSFMGGTGLYTFNDDGSGGALEIYEISDDLSDNVEGFDDITRLYLNDPANNEVNVVMWSWCSLNTDFNDIDQYLWSMTQLEKEYPNILFVYMTGHLDGSGETGPVHLANERIRAYCLANETILYDFADIESYNPDDLCFLNLGADDNCTYSGGNWAVEWQNTHEQGEGKDWYDCSCTHSQPLNGNMKAYGSWYLFARLAGWNGS